LLGVNMPFQPNKNGVRGRRIKDLIYAVLKDNPQGMSASELYSNIQAYPNARYVSNSHQVGSHAKQLPGVESEVALESIITSSSGSRSKPLIYKLEDPTAWPKLLNGVKG
jgi:hypothetical protein